MYLLLIFCSITVLFSCSALQRPYDRHTFIEFDGFETESDEEKKTLNSLSPIAEGISPTTYQVVLQNQESLAFTKEQLECSGFLAPQIRSDRADIYITRYITHGESNNPDEVTLQEVHEILRIIADNKEHPHQVLRKLLVFESISVERVTALLQVASYLEIQSLLEVMHEYLLTQDITQKNWKNLFAQMPDDEQRTLVMQYLMKDQKNLEVVLHSEKIRKTIWKNVIRKSGEFASLPKVTHATLHDQYLLFSCIDASAHVYDCKEEKITTYPDHVSLADLMTDAKLRELLQKQREFELQKKSVSPDGKYCVSVNEKNMQVWDNTEEKPTLLYELPLHIITRDYVPESFGDSSIVHYIVWMPNSKSFIYNYASGGREYYMFYNEIYWQKLITPDNFSMTYAEMLHFKKSVANSGYFFDSNEEELKLQEPIAKAIKQYARDKKCCPLFLNGLKNKIGSFWRNRMLLIPICLFSAFLLTTHSR